MTVSVPNLPTQPGFIHLSDEERKVRGAHIPPYLRARSTRSAVIRDQPLQAPR